MYYNHNLRTNLQEWKARLYKAPYNQFGNQLKYLLSNLENNKLLFGLIEAAKLSYPFTEEEFQSLYEELQYGQIETSFENEMHHCSFCYQFLKYILSILKSYDIHKLSIFYKGEFEDSKRAIIEEYITPIFNYLHDKLDKSNSTIYLLEKYKRRTEWFTHHHLFNRYLAAEKNYEEIFEEDLRLFLFDQGIEYPFSTPKTASGRSDIVGSIETEDPLIIEIKIFDRKKGYGKQRIIEGFSQILKYTNDFSKDVGYLVVFNTDTAEINFELSDKSNIFPPMVIMNSKTYFLVIVNLNRSISASKVGTTELITINESELTKEPSPL